MSLWTKPLDVPNHINRFGQYFQAGKFVFQRLTKYIKRISRLKVHESVVLIVFMPIYCNLNGTRHLFFYSHFCFSAEAIFSIILTTTLAYVNTIPVVFFFYRHDKLSGMI